MKHLSLTSDYSCAYSLKTNFCDRVDTMWEETLAGKLRQPGLKTVIYRSCNTTPAEKSCLTLGTTKSTSRPQRPLSFWSIQESRPLVACSRLSVSEDDRKSERATSGISGERDPGEKRRGRDLSFFPTRPRSSPAAFSIVPADREPGTGRPLAGSDFLSMRREFISYSQSIRLDSEHA